MEPADDTWLTVDQGNSSLDAVLFSLAGPPVVLHSWQRVELGELLAQASDSNVHGVSFASVRGPAAARELEDALASAFPNVSSPSCGLALAVDSPEPAGAVVVDVGTAMTVDLVRDGAFQGGAIAPGPQLLARALGAGAAQLFEVELRPGVPALGRDTRAALEAGVVVGLRGAARALSEELLAAAGPGARLFVTGGARALLLEPRPYLDGVELFEVPLLVPLGLLWAGTGLAAGVLALEDFGRVRP